MLVLPHENNWDQNPNPQTVDDRVLQVGETNVTELGTKIENSFVSFTKKENESNKSMLNLNPLASIENKSHETKQVLLGIFYNSSKENSWNDSQEAFEKHTELETTTKLLEIYETSIISHIPAPDYWLIASCIILIALILIIILILIRILCSL